MGRPILRFHWRLIKNVISGGIPCIQRRQRRHDCNDPLFEIFFWFWSALMMTTEIWDDTKKSQNWKFELLFWILFEQNVFNNFSCRWSRLSKDDYGWKKLVIQAPFVICGLGILGFDNSRTIKWGKTANSKRLFINLSC